MGCSRYRGVPGEDPADVDVLVIGDADPDDVFEALRPVEASLGRPINVVLRSRLEWERENTGFVQWVARQPDVDGSPISRCLTSTRS